MKKYVILTSVLALTACAGGSGGGNPGEIVTPSNYVDRVAQSNANITGMISNSEYQVAKYVANKLGDDAESVNLSRTATIRSAFQPSNPNSGNIDYDTARELVDLAGWLVDDTTSETDIVEMFNKSALDKNKIKAALKLMDDMYCFVGGDAEETARRIKKSDFEKPLTDLQQKTEVFDLEKVKYVFADEGFGGKIQLTLNPEGVIDGITILADDEDDEDKHFIRDEDIFNGEVNVGPGQKSAAKLKYNSIAKEKNLNLRYSDFGVFDIDVIEGWRPVFIGGYDDVKKVIPTNDEIQTFNGRAVGHVMAIKNGEGSGTALPLDADATLKFKNGESTLIASFDNWYDIKYNESGDNRIIEFSNYQNDDRYKLITAESDNKVTITNNIESDIRYFGDDNTPSEAVGLIQVRDCGGGECTSDYDNTPEVRMNLGFGAK